MAIYPGNLAEIECFKEARKNIEARIEKAVAVRQEMADELLTKYRADLMAFDFYFEDTEDGRWWRECTDLLKQLRVTQQQIDPSGEVWREVIAVRNIKNTTSARI